MIHMKPMILKSLLLTVLSLSFHGLCIQTDTITSTSSISDPDFLLSAGRVFKLGFFTLENTTNRYLAIFYDVSEQTIMWVANRDNPLTDASGHVTISGDGNLVLTDGQNQTVWSTNATSSSSAAANMTAQILDSGNLVLRENQTGKIVWDSF